MPLIDQAESPAARSGIPVQHVPGTYHAKAIPLTNHTITKLRGLRKLKFRGPPFTPPEEE